MKQKMFIPVFTLVGGVLIIAGTLLPWITAMGGLQVYSGIAGLYGQILLGTGILAFFLGIGASYRTTKPVQWVIGLLGFIILAFCSWLLIELFRTNQVISRDSMIIGGIGPGLFVVTIGAILLFTTLFFDTKYGNI